MSSRLMDIQPAAVVYADLLSKILKVEVAIADENLQQVAGTGRTFGREAQQQTAMAKKGGLLFHALQSGQIQVFEDPGDEPNCGDCIQRDRCQVKYQMSAPIIVNKEVKGILAFITSNKIEKDRILKKKQLYLDFLVQFADLLSLKLLEHAAQHNQNTQTELLNILLDHADVGILIFDNDGQLSQMNPVSYRLLPIDETLPVEAKLSLLDPGNEESRFLLTVKSREYRLLGKLHHISIDNTSNVFIFSNGMKVKSSTDSGQHHGGIGRIWGESGTSRQIRKKILEYAPSNAIVLITGNSGTEKKEVALALHEQGRDPSRPFVTVNCRAFSEDILEKELLGINAGPSKKGRQGKFEQAAGGTLVIEDIDGLSLSMQAKFLRILEEGAITRIGGAKSLKIHVRIIVTATADLIKMMKDGTFLEALFYRIFILPIHIPPLCERKEDIRSIGSKFLNQEAKKIGKAIVSVDSPFWGFMERYSWPGNVWQLKGAMEYVINAMGNDGMITARLVPDNILAYSQTACLPTVYEPEEAQFNLKKIEEATIRKVLQLYGTDSDAKQMAADKLGIGIATLYRKMKQYHL